MATHLPSYNRASFSKIIGNTYIFNGGLNHIDATVDAGCRFCHLNSIRPVNKETIKHLSGCEYFINFFKEMLDIGVDSPPISTDQFFLGADGLDNASTEVINFLIANTWHYLCKYRNLTSLTIRKINTSLIKDLHAGRSASRRFERICGKTQKKFPRWGILTITEPGVYRNRIFTHPP